MENNTAEADEMRALDFRCAESIVTQYRALNPLAFVAPVPPLVASALRRLQRMEEDAVRDKLRAS